jgi:hypothetical protein
MFRRSLMASVLVLALSAGRAEAISVRDVIELSKAGLSEPVLLALIEVDRSIFAIDTASLKQLKAAGVSDTVIVAMIRSGRPAAPSPQELQPQPMPEPAPPADPPQPQVVVIDHHDAPAPQPVAYPVYVPVVANPYAVNPYGVGRRHDNTVTTTISTDQGIVKARVPVPPNCVKAQPVFWGFDGKLRPGSWEPQPTVVCR